MVGFEILPYTILQKLAGGLIMSHKMQYLVFLGERPRNLKNPKLYMDNPLYRLHFEPGESKEIIDDDYNGANRIPYSIAVQYARIYKHLLKVEDEELTDDEYLQVVLENLIDEFGIGVVGAKFSLYITDPIDVEPDKNNVISEVNEILNAKSVKKKAKPKK